MHTIRTDIVTALAAALVGLSGCGQEAPARNVQLVEVPAASGSIGANTATAPDGTVILSWIESDGTGHALRYSLLRDDRWEAPRTVASGNDWFVNWADFPSVVPLSGSLWGAHWLASQPEGGYAYDVRLSISTDGGNSWGESFVPHTDNTPTEHGFVSLFADEGALGLVWLDGRKMVNEFDESDIGASGMTLRTAVFDADGTESFSSLVDELTCDCCQTDVAVTDEGPVVAYRDRTTDEVRDIYLSRRESGAWRTGAAVADDNWLVPACPVNGPIVRANGKRVAVAWFTAANDQPRVKAAWSGDSGRTFAAPIEVSSERPLGHVAAVMLADGDLVVGWHGSAGEGRARMMLRRVSPSGAASEPFVLHEAADVFAFSVPQLALRGDELVVVWTTSVNKVYGIASALVPLEVFDKR